MTHQKKNDIIVGETPDSWAQGRTKPTLIKRVAATTGDTITVEGGKLKVNGKEYATTKGIRLPYQQLQQKKYLKGTSLSLVTTRHTPPTLFLFSANIPPTKPTSSRKKTSKIMEASKNSNIILIQDPVEGYVAQTLTETITNIGTPRRSY